MIDQALQLVRDRLNDHLRIRFAVSEDLVSLSPLTDVEGKPAKEARNRLVLFMVNIARDTVPRQRTARGAAPTLQAQPLHMDVYFMVASGHDVDLYPEGLKLVSAALMFFQSQPVFTPQSTPDMPQGLSQLTVEVSNMGLEEVGQIWSNLGSRYVPSVMFKMRSVMIDASMTTGIAPTITAPSQRAEAETV
ncbi:hypothetical protein So717_24340 [Roseobacter cerasinus]|uniref:Pvc16 N-terminal domain-containing protein n=1 Tax=Roseobacter cerasinus TaxID=2602289 RepID=A0A640VUA5_9RHOB|nr:DUF4255 domain-containing protein [Roseobacter cerasinus]GFE50681.1 hypothetical protein So717_24340 [Roseobacter cerasinus]